MPKKQSSETNQGLTSRGVLLVLGITALVAIIIIVVFTFFLKQDNTDTQDYQKYLNELKQQSNVPRKESNGVKEEIVRRTVRGVLTEIKTDGLAVTAENSSEKINFILRNDTVITYQNQTFDRSHFFVGDQLEIIAREEIDGELIAETVTVLVSASPATPAPLPQITPQNIQPDGSIKPL